LIDPLTDDDPPRIIVAVDRKPARWEIVSPGALLAILAFINFLNYVDRTVIGGLVPFLKDRDTGLGLTSSQIGLLQSAFMVVHSIASIPLGVMADRYMRKRLIAIGVGVWSVATAAAGFARGFTQIFVARAAVGIGEATYAPAASALISDRFPESERARAMGVFQLGTILGGGVGVIVGGYVARIWGWRAAFFVVGLPGLVLSLLVLLLHERDPAPKVDKPSLSLRIPLGTPASITALMYIVVAGIMTSFFTGALQIWGPAFLLRALFNGDKMRINEVNFRFGPTILLAGALGAFAGSYIADRLEARHPGKGRLLTVALSVFAAAPCVAIAFAAHEGWLIYTMLAVGAFFAVFYIGPILAALHDVVPSELRATATGAYFFAIHAFGDSVSPWLVGKIDDITHSLRYGLLVATGVFLLAGFAALAAIPGSVRVARLKAAIDAE
jgi:MFS transporter, Spinster family, sphingosine-1-phosphate transporter